MSQDIVAFRERESMDPLTGDAGILRGEWRVSKVETFAPSELENAWGADWRRYKPFAEWVLEHRCIRRGVQESWRPFECANSYEQALEYIDDKATALNDRLIALQEARRRAREEDKRKREEEARKATEEERKAEQARRSRDAFDRLWNGKDGDWARRWNTAIVWCQATPKLFEVLKTSEDFTRLHADVIAAVTVPVKRKAIKAALAWLAKEHGLNFEPLKETVINEEAKTKRGG
jgi:hypothetical protein